MAEFRGTFGDEFEGELDVESVGAVQIPGHKHPHAVLHMNRHGSHQPVSLTSTCGLTVPM